MTVTQQSARSARAAMRAATLRATCSRCVRWFHAPRLARARRRRAALAAAMAAAGPAFALLAPAAARDAMGAATGIPTRDVPPDAPFALVLRTTVPTPLAGARMTLRLTVVNAGGWWATLTVHTAEPSLR